MLVPLECEIRLVLLTPLEKLQCMHALLAAFPIGSPNFFSLTDSGEGTPPLLLRVRQLKVNTTSLSRAICQQVQR